MDLTKSIMELKGIGEKNAALFHKLNIETIEDLLYHFPADLRSCHFSNSENNACSRTCQESVYSEAAGRGCAWGTSSYLIF